MCCLEQSLADNSDGAKKNKINLVSAAMDAFKKSKNEFLMVHSEEYLRLLRYQQKLEEKFPSKKFFDLSLQNTMKMLIQSKEYKLSDEMKKDFKVPDKRYYYLKLLTLAEINEWPEIEKLSRAKRSPIGYEVCINLANSASYANAPFIIIIFIHVNQLVSCAPQPFVDVCIQHGKKYEAQKYLSKVRDENKIKYYVKTE